jgi:peptidyl-prolyl cis-trans isomerase C
MSRVSSRIHRAAGILAAALAVGLAVFPATLRGQTSVPTKPAPAAPAKPAASARAQSPAAAPATPNPLRDVFFGETHLHTSWSFDAYVFGNTLAGPEDAYQFALGKPIRHPAGYMVQIKRPAKVEDHRIELTAADVRQLEIVWTAQWRRGSTQEELQGLVESRVREEILYREALALGLERGDTIIRRRLAQKMEFLADDLSGVRTPSVEELRAWYSRNAARFADPGRRSFRHVYFSADRRGDRAQQDATRALVKLGRTPADATALSAIGDAFMFQEHYADRTPEQVAAIFGSQFAEVVRQLPVGTWQGPIESGLGWHLVLVTSATPGRVPAFDEIVAEIQAAWMEDQRSEARRRAFDVMKARYEVRVPALSRAHNETAAPAPTATP